MPDPIDVHVGSRVRLRRTLLGLSQESLAQSLDLTFQQVQKYERGSNRIGASRLVRIADVLGIEASWFFDEMPEEIAGFGAKGMSEEGEPYQADKTMLRRETLEFVRNVAQIEDGDVKDKLVQLIEALAKASEQAG